jgi:predicted transcriptional regulator
MNKEERRDLNRRRIIAEKYRRLEDDYNLTEKEIAAELGVTVDVVKRLGKELWNI